MYMQCTLRGGQVTTEIGFVEADGVRFMYFGFGRKIVSADALPGRPRLTAVHNVPSAVCILPQSQWAVLQHQRVTGDLLSSLQNWSRALQIAKAMYWLDAELAQDPSFSSQ